MKFFGVKAADFVGYEDNDWLIEPYVHGYVGHMPLGSMTRFGSTLRQPCAETLLGERTSSHKIYV
jgi:monoamine oxidase